MRITERDQGFKRRKAPSGRVIKPVPIVAPALNNMYSNSMSGGGNNNNINLITGQKAMLPSLYLLNARSLSPKLDELTALLATSPVDLVAITESWLRSDIDDSLLSISAFNLFRKDRIAGRGGGICVYLNNVIPCKRRLDSENPIFECLWLTLHPKRLPRPLSGMAICVAYHPPGRPTESHKELNDYLINTTDRLRNEHPDQGLVLLGDFNDFDCKSSNNLPETLLS